MGELRKIPMVRIACCFMLGIICSSLLSETLWLSFTLFLLFGICIFNRIKGDNRYYLTGLVFHLVLFSIGALWKLSFQSPQTPEITRTVFHLKEIDHIRKGKNHYSAYCKAYTPGKPSIGSVIYFEKSQCDSLNLEVGDELWIFGALKPLKKSLNPTDFDYTDFLNKRGITYSISKSSFKILKHKKPSFNIKRWANNCRNWCVARLDKVLDNRELAVASALIIGEEELLDKDVRNLFSSTGAMHVLSVSGLHVGIIYLMLGFLLKKPLTRTGKGWLFPLISILVLWLYAFISGLSPSVQRAAFMFSILSLGSILHRRSNIFNNLAGSAFILCVFNPYTIYNIGFQLSYLALIGILIFQKPLALLIYSRYKIIRWFWDMTSVAIAAQLTTTVISIMYFHQFPTYFFLSNLVVVPLSFAALIIGIPYILLSDLSFFAKIIGTVLEWSLRMMNNSLEILSELPYALITNLNLSLLTSILLYAILASLALFWTAGIKRALTISLVLVNILMIFSISNFTSGDYVYLHSAKLNAEVIINQQGDTCLLADNPLCNQVNYYLKDIPDRSFKSSIVPFEGGSVLVSGSFSRLHLTNYTACHKFKNHSFDLIIIDFPMEKLTYRFPHSKVYLLSNQLSKSEKARWKGHVRSLKLNDTYREGFVGFKIL